MKTKNRLKRTFKGILLILLFIGIDFAYAQKDPKGEKLIAMNQYKTAKSYFLNKFKQNPNDAFTNYYLGQIYFNTESYDSASYYFQNGLKNNPNDPYNIIGNGSILVNSGKNAEAEKEFRKAASLTKYKDPYIMIAIADGAISGKNKNYDIATEFIQKAKDINKKIPQIYLVFGDMYLYQSDFGKGATEYENAFYYDKSCTEGYYKLGRIYASARNFNASDSAYLNALKFDSTYIPALRDLSELYYNYGKYSKSSEAFQKYLSLTEPNLNDHFRYATILFYNKEYQKSLDEANKALNEDKSMLVMKRLQAYSLFEIKDYVNGLQSINDFFNMAPQKKLIISDYEYYGKLLNKNNQDSLAIFYFDTVLNMDPTKTALYNEIGDCYNKLKKYEKAVYYFDKNIKSKGNATFADYYQLGLASFYTCSKYYTIENPTKEDSINRTTYFTIADTAFGSAISLSDQYHYGYYRKARLNMLIDKESTLGLSKQWYEKVISILEPTPEKGKKELLEAYQYFGYYYYINNDKNMSKDYWNKILTIDPNNEQAAKSIEALKKMK